MSVSKGRFVAGKLMRRGYTTGTCAAAAAKAAVMMLLTQTRVDSVRIKTPGGKELKLQILEAGFDMVKASCAVKKDSGDDPDVTNGALVFASVCLIPSGIEIDGGEGVGKVTKPGLDQPVGNAAINSVPRRMISGAIAEASLQNGYGGGVRAVISVPGGKELAEKTFNPRLGICGGISILGTSGIVEPMSNAALISTIRAELEVLSASGEKKLLVTPGNYGEKFAADILNIGLNRHIKCSNFIGDALAAASELGFSDILVAGHIGKLVKLGIGASNTHSSSGDGRRETLIACALRAKAPYEVLELIDDSATTDAAVEILRESGHLAKTMEILGGLIENTLRRMVLPETKIGFVCFSGEEILIKSDNSGDIIESLKR